MLVVTCTPFVLSNVLVSRLTPQNVPKPGKKTNWETTEPIKRRLSMCWVHAWSCSKARMTDLGGFAWVQPVNTVQDNRTTGSGVCVPAPASSSCGRRRAETPQWRPTACCGPETAGCPCMGPGKDNWVTAGDRMGSVGFATCALPECIQWEC